VSTESKSPEESPPVSAIALPVLIARAGGSVAITREERDRILKRYGRAGQFVIESEVIDGVLHVTMLDPSTGAAATPFASPPEGGPTVTSDDLDAHMRTRWGWFVGLAIKHFGFLEREHQYRLAAVSQHRATVRVRWQGAANDIEPYLDVPESEVNVMLTEHPRPDSTRSSLQRALPVDTALVYRRKTDIRARLNNLNPPTVDKALGRLAKALKDDLPDVLEGRPDIFDEAEVILAKGRSGVRNVDWWAR